MMDKVMDKEHIKFWTPLIVMLVSFVSAFVWLQADVKAAESKIQSLMANSSQLELIQKRLEIDSEVYKEKLEQLKRDSNSTQLLLRELLRRSAP